MRSQASTHEHFLSSGSYLVDEPAAKAQNCLFPNGSSLSVRSYMEISLADHSGKVAHLNLLASVLLHMQQTTDLLKARTQDKDGTDVIH